MIGQLCVNVSLSHKICMQPFLFVCLFVLSVCLCPSVCVALSFVCLLSLLFPATVIIGLFVCLFMYSAFVLSFDAGV